VADVEFGNFVYACDRAHISGGQSVASGNVQAVLGGQGRAFTQTPQFVIGAHGPFAMNSCCP